MQTHQFPAVRFVGVFFEGMRNLSLRQDSVERFEALTQADALVVTVGGSVIEIDTHSVETGRLGQIQPVVGSAAFYIDWIAKHRCDHACEPFEASAVHGLI